MNVIRKMGTGVWKNKARFLFVILYKSQFKVDEILIVRLETLK